MATLAAASSNPCAGPAYPSAIRRDIEIGAAKWVATDTLSLLTINCSRPNPSQGVHAASDWLQMRWVYAGWVTTQVIKLESCRNRSMGQHPRESMCPSALSGFSLKMPITQSGVCTMPEPA